MNRPRLERLTAMLREKIDAGVPHGGEGCGTDDRFPEVFDITDWGEKDHCGTVACIGGFATLDPELRAEGLRNVGDDWPGNNTLRPTFQYKRDGSALVRFFDISDEEVLYIFGDSNPNTLESGVRRVERVLDGSWWLDETEGEA